MNKLQYLLMPYEPYASLILFALFLIGCVILYGCSAWAAIQREYPEDTRES